jgi:hypothetical protein
MVIAWIFTFDWWRGQNTLIRFIPLIIWLSFCADWFIPDRTDDWWQLIAIPSIMDHKFMAHHF